MDLVGENSVITGELNDGRHIERLIGEKKIIQDFIGII
jgi:hypothetical protein